jgi:Nucleotidyltransferase domain
VHIYAFGSICRGEISPGSDIDLLAVVGEFDVRFDKETYSIYSYKRVAELWKEGNPFAWHLLLESRLLFSSDGNDYLKTLGNPAPYKDCVRDCRKFLRLFQEGADSIATKTTSVVFDLSAIFLSIRNFATCFSLGTMETPSFSRDSALRLGSHNIPLSNDSFRILERARILCTRGFGRAITNEQIALAIQELGKIQEWMDNLMQEVIVYGQLHQSSVGWRLREKCSKQ